MHFRVGWAKQHLKKAGLVDSPKRAYYQLTAEGFKAIQYGAEKVDVSIYHSSIIIITQSKTLTTIGLMSRITLYLKVRKN